MQNQHKPVLIFAQSGRFLAQLATQAGYRAWVADCFGDVDTLSIAERWQPLPPFAELSSEQIIMHLSMLSQDEDCILLCGSGIESTYPFLEQLPANIQLIGNSIHTLKIIKTPALFFEMLDQQNLSFPKTQFESPTDNSIWLVKSASGLGGEHIQNHNDGKASHLADSYFQHFVAGVCGSVLFLANGKQAQLISINKQTISPIEKAPFRLGNIESPWLLPDHHLQELELAINKITLATGLLGINSLDFIISEQGDLLLLEVNPRLSASAELLHDKAPLFKHHINACLGTLPSVPIIQSTLKASLKYIYASHDLTIPANMIWPNECHDMPAAGSFIYNGKPIYTSIVHPQKNQHANNLHHLVERKIYEQFLTTP